MSELERLTDDALMMRYKNDNDERAFNVLYSRYSGSFNEDGKRVASPAMRYLMGLVRNTHNAEIIFSQSWEKIIKSKDRFESGNFRAYFFRVMRNAYLDFYREQKRKQRRLNVQGGDSINSEGHKVMKSKSMAAKFKSMADEFEKSEKKQKNEVLRDRTEDLSKNEKYNQENPTVEDRAIQKECVNLLLEAISGLPDDQRKCLLLRLKTDMTYLQIADELDTKVEAVKSRLRYARDKLKAKIPPECLKEL